MKKSILFVLFFVSLFTNAQSTSTSYEPLWEKVYENELDLLPKSALEKVNKIYDKARKENNQPQKIRCLLYQSKFALDLEENAQLKIVNNFKSEIKATTDRVEKAILHSLLAHIYWEYYKKNRWKILRRTKTDQIINENFIKWDITTLHTQIHKHFKLSLKDSEVLKNTKQISYQVLIKTFNEDTETNIFEFLAHNALAFYKENESSLTQPKEPFVIDKKEYLTKIDSYVFDAPDTLSTKYQSLNIYQELIKTHKKGQEAYFKTLLQTIDYISKNNQIDDFEEIKFSFLKELQQKYKSSKAIVFIDFEIAKTYYEFAKTYTPSHTKHQYDFNKSLEICKQLIKNNPEHSLAQDWKNLINAIENKSLTCKTEQYMPVDQNQKALITYRNVDAFYGKIYKVNRNQYLQIEKEYSTTKKDSLIKLLPVSAEWKSVLPNKNDHQQHKTEILLPKTPQGQYILVCNYDNNPLNNNHSYFQITNLTLLKKDENQFQVLDRMDGSGYTEAKVHLKNNSSYYGNRPKINQKFTTNKNGEFQILKNKTYQNITAKVTTTKDTAYFENIYLYRDREKSVNTKTTYKPFVFTDRSIYRPGQEVFFKTIVLKSKGEITEVLSNETIEIALYDVNNQKIRTKELTLNDFGTAAATFKLPLSGLNGQFSFKVFRKGNNIAYVNTRISVEEYKRPKFKTSFKPIKETFKINDSITVIGEANALSGSKITNAKVTYRVVRKAKFPRWCWWRTPKQPTEIAHGETTSNDKGEYPIKFKAFPDVEVDPKNQPTFYYTVYADVTDINGETRSTETEIAVGYHTMNLELSTKYTLNVLDKNEITIDSENLNGEFVPAKGTLKIYKLIAPETVYRERPWSSPDIQSFSKENYKQLFPFETYQEEDQNPRNWKKGEIVFSKEFDTKKETKIRLKKTKKWALGKYIMIAESKDPWGQLVKDEKIVSLHNPKAKQVSDNQIFSISIDEETYQPNDEVILSVGTSVNNMTVFVEIEKDHQIIATHQILLNNEIKKITIPVTEKDRGGFAIKWHRVNYNTMDKGIFNINVPHPSKKLNIETRTFRDVLEPGQTEKWSFKITGSNQEKVTAEVLASMYDASLDQFKPHDWFFNPTQLPIYRTSNYIQVFNNFNTTTLSINNNNHFNHQYKLYKNEFNWFGFSFTNNSWVPTQYLRQISWVLKNESDALFPPPPPFPEQFDGIESVEYSDEVAFISRKKTFTGEFNMEKKRISTTMESPSELSSNDDKTILEEQLDQVKPRINFNETAFFFPQLKTDANGEVSFEFTMPEDLTEWKLQLLAHDKELNTGIKTLTAVTQKKIMVTPNAPRFLREGDQITLSTKIANLTKNVLQGKVKLELTDAVTGKNIDALLQNTNATQNFSVVSKGNSSAAWTLQIPENITAVQYKIVAATNNFSDGEQNVLPVLSNRMLVTETLPLWVNGGESKVFTLEGLKNSDSETLKHHQLSLEITSNPAWYAVQALPYLMEYPHECAEQTFARFYANQLASHIVNSNPKIKEVFKQWANSETLISNLEKNQELKSIIIQETPWLRDVQSETEQKKRIALLFDLSKMGQNLESTVKKLDQIQMNNGGFPWFKGGRYANRYITQHIVQGYQHLKQLGVELNNNKIDKIVSKAQQFLDNELLEVYHDLLKRAETIKDNAKTKKEGIRLSQEYLDKKHLYSFQLQYLYVLSFNLDRKLDGKLKEAVAYYKNQAKMFWKEENLHNKGMLALIHHRNKEKAITQNILKSLKENSILSDEMGRYWKENTSGWSWYQDPIVTQSLMIELFSEVEENTLFVDELKQWLLKNKQVQQWKTTKATSEAVYALLLQGSEWLAVDEAVEINIGEKKLDVNTLENVKVEAGTGYFKTKWSPNEINNNMATVTLTKKENGVAWGGLYWQYFEDLDKIKQAETPLALKKEVFIKKNTDSGPTLTLVTPETMLNVGDLLTIRIELTTDRNLEFIHMKDMRASGLEPVDVLSGYKWQDRLGYYQSTKDAATHFFFDTIRKGIYVFEYDLRVSHKGIFSNGITNIESMYAPEFSSHSKGIKMKVK